MTARHQSIVFAILLIAAGCGMVPPGPPLSPAAEATCSFDAQCPAGSCRFGTCSPFPPDDPGCSFDSQCPGGSCRFGTCSPSPPDNPGCSFDSQCPGGSCQLGSCSPFPAP